MAAQKVEFEVQIVPDTQEVAAQLKTGGTVSLVYGEDGCIQVLTTDQQVIGAISGTAAEAVPWGVPSGTIRSIRKAPGSSTVAGLRVRVTSGGQQPPLSSRPAVHEALPAQHQQQEEQEVEAAMRLSRSQLENLAGSADVREQLQDKQLQALVAGIDGAANRPAALQDALQNPDLQAFADKVLATIAAGK